MIGIKKANVLVGSPLQGDQDQVSVPQVPLLDHGHILKTSKKAVELGMIGIKKANVLVGSALQGVQDQVSAAQCTRFDSLLELFSWPPTVP